MGVAMKYKRMISGYLMLMLSILACTLFTPRAQKTATLTPIPVMTEAVQSLQETVESVATQVQETGQVNLVIDETQLTSIAALELSKQDQAQIPFQDPQIHLQNGQIQITGSVVRQGVKLAAQMNMTVSVDQQGQVEVNIISAKIGLLPLPTSVITDYNDQINQAFMELLDSLSPNTQVESITIADGKMTIIGHTR
jgi:uncharacterized protein YpmS